MRSIPMAFAAVVSCGAAVGFGAAEGRAGATIRVPQDRPTIQAGIDAAQAGDTVLVSAGTYKERVRLKPGIVLRSAGDDAPGELGLKRAEATIVDGGGRQGKGAGIEMAADSVVDGMTVTNVGFYDDAEWNRHFATQGEEQPEENIGVPGVAGISAIGVDCEIRRCIVHHIGYSGIAILGSPDRRVAPYVHHNVTYRNMGGGIGLMRKTEGIVEANLCFENFYAGIGHADSSPLVIGNECHGNVRAGIGVSSGACPTVRGNKCWKNRRAGIGIRTGAETQPIVERNECWENDMAGIGNRDEARPIIRHNRCWKNRMAGIGSRDHAAGVIEFNECFENGMAGIGSRLGAAPVIRENKCHHNEMAGIGAREEAAPVIVANECWENGMAGIGCRDGAAPVIRDNKCHHNRMAGIGSMLGARPVIVANECWANDLAGIGTRLGARPVIVDNLSRENAAAGIGVQADSVAVVVGNRCIENKLVAIGLPDGGTALLVANECVRTGGVPPLVAVKGGSTALLAANELRGGGVAGVLVEGRAALLENRFVGRGPAQGQGSAIWVWKGSDATIADNLFAGFRNAVNASGSKVSALDNRVRDFQSAAIVVAKPSAPARVSGTVAVSANPADRAAKVDAVAGATAPQPEGPDGTNVVQTPEQAGDDPAPGPFALLRRGVEIPRPEADPAAPPPAEERHEVRDGRWKLVLTRGPKGTKTALYDAQTDPEDKADLAAKLDNIAFRLQGMWERRDAAERSPGPGGPKK